MRILIAGSNYNALLLAKYIKETSNGAHEIYLTAEEAPADGSYIPVNIKENDIEALCSFAENNSIDYTYAASSLAVINGIADEFIKKGLAIAAPSSDASRMVFFNSTAKKVLYKLKISTPRFGIFDRENIAADYLKRAKFPVCIMNDFTLNEKFCAVYSSLAKARSALQKIFENKNEKIIIENYIEAEPVYIYFLTDGYNAAPLITIDRSSFEHCITAAAPSGVIDRKTINDIMNRAVFPFLDDAAKYTSGYAGILGLKIKIQENHFYVLDIYNDFQSCDMQAFLSLFDGDYAELLYYAASGQLKTRQSARLADKVSYTAAVKKSDIIKESIDDEGFFISNDGINTIITAASASKSAAEKHVKWYLEEICMPEVYENIVQETEKALRI